jgi:hypothetical protein
MQRNVFSAIRLEYSGNPTIKVSIDGTLVSTNALPYHSTFRGRRITLPEAISGYIPHLETLAAVTLQNEMFDALPIENYNIQQLFHYVEFGFRGADTLTPSLYLDGAAQEQTYDISTNIDTDVARIYFDKLAYGYIPHLFHNGTSTNDAEILWAKPVALPPRFYRGIRTHSEFQITYKGEVSLEWFLDGISLGTYTFDSTESLGLDSNDNPITGFITKTDKAYFPSGTIGHVLQYIHLNPEDGGRIYVVESDTTLGDLEQQAMSPQIGGL